MDVNFQTELEGLFRTNFLQAAPLYQASSKFKLPYEDLKQTTRLYAGAVHEVVRTVEEYADYFRFEDEFRWTPMNARGVVARFGKEAGIFVDGLIRGENLRNHRDHDPRNTTDMKVVDIFDHVDGRRNLQIMAVRPTEWNPADPFKAIPGWIAYRFYFAAGVVSSQYKKP